MNSKVLKVSTIDNINKMSIKIFNIIKEIYLISIILDKKF